MLQRQYKPSKQIGQSQCGVSKVRKAAAKIFLAGEDLDWTGRRCLMYGIPIYAEITIIKDESQKHIASIIQNGSIEHISDLLNYSYTGEFNDYIRAGLYLWNKDICPVSGIRLIVKSSVPVAAGLGSSAAILNALFLSLSNYYKIDLNNSEIVRLGYKTEHDIIGSTVGKVDFYISLNHGVMLYENNGGHMNGDDSIDEAMCGDKCISINTNFKHTEILLVNTGKISRTIEVNSDRYRRFINKDPSFIKYLEITDSIVGEGVRAAQNNDLFEMGRLISEAHIAMSLYLRNSDHAIDDIVHLCDRNGAYGTKLTGSGKGGYVFSIIDSDRCSSLEKVLESYNIEYIKVPFI